LRNWGEKAAKDNSCADFWVEVAGAIADEVVVIVVAAQAADKH
jgi:hypothetical protein